MNKKFGIVLLTLILAFAGTLFADKPLERQANELGVEAETKYNAKDYVEAGKTFEAAIAKYNEAVETDGIPMDNKKVDRWLKFAFNGYFAGKDFDNALRILDERLKVNPGKYDLIKYKVIIYSKYKKDIDKAIEILVDYNSTKRSAKVEKKIASFYSAKEDYENALIWYKKSYELDQGSEVIKNIANLYIKLGNNAEAVNAYEDFIKTNPKESVLAKTYKNMGVLYGDLRNTAKSIEYYEKSMKIKYDSSLNLILITQYYDNKQYDRALVKIDQLLQNKPGSAAAIYYRAMIKYDRGDKAGAKADFQKIAADVQYGSSAKGFIESIESE